MCHMYTKAGVLHTHVVQPEALAVEQPGEDVQHQRVQCSQRCDGQRGVGQKTYTKKKKKCDTKKKKLN